MKISRLVLLLCALVSLALAGCGGGDEDVPADAVAIVDGEEIARSDYEALITQAKKSYTNQKREFPAAGSQEFQTLRNQAVQFLVQREQFAQEAENLDVEVTDKQIDARLEKIQKQYFGGDKKKYEKQLKEQGITEEQVRNDIRAQIISEKIFAAGHRRGEGDRRADRGRTTRRTRRSTASRRAARCATSSSRRRSRPTTSTRSCRAAATSPRSRRSSPRTPARRRTAAS